MLQLDKPDDFVLATGETKTVREFIEKSFQFFNEQIIWEGEGINERGILQSTGQVVVKIDPSFYRPTEVDFLLGDASKAKEKNELAT